MPTLAPSVQSSSRMQREGTDVTQTKNRKRWTTRVLPADDMQQRAWDVRCDGRIVATGLTDRGVTHAEKLARAIKRACMDVEKDRP